MLRFLPAILEQTASDFQGLFELLDGLVTDIQVDFADSTLVSNRTVLPAELPVITTPTALHAHLMVDRPSQYFKRLAKLGYQSVFVHIESSEEIDRLYDLATELQMVFNLVVNPTTPLEAVKPYQSYCQVLQLMAIEPGFGGQPFQDITYDRLKQAKQLFPSLSLAVDGGVRLPNAKKLIECGAEWLIVGRGGYEDQLEKTVRKWQDLIHKEA